MLDGDTDSRYQRTRGVLHHTQDGRRGSLGKNQAGWHCDQYNNRCYESSKRTQTDTHSPYHIPLLSNANPQIRKSIWQASRPWSRLFLAVYAFIKTIPRRQQFQETNVHFKCVFSLRTISYRFAGLVKKIEDGKSGGEPSPRLMLMIGRPPRGF